MKAPATRCPRFIARVAGGHRQAVDRLLQRRTIFLHNNQTNSMLKALDPPRAGQTRITISVVSCAGWSNFCTKNKRAVAQRLSSAHNRKRGVSGDFLASKWADAQILVERRGTVFIVPDTMWVAPAMSRKPRAVVCEFRDLVLLDWILPGIPGRPFTPRARGDQRTRDM